MSMSSKFLDGTLRNSGLTPQPTPTLTQGDGGIMDLSEYKVQGPPSIFYIPNFISEEDETLLLDKIYKAPKPKWTQLANRRLQNWGGLPHPRGMVAETIPAWLKKYVDDIEELNLFNGKHPNHVLVNEYQAGQGIMPHLDGSLFHPTITTVTIGSHGVLNFYTPLTTTTHGMECVYETMSFGHSSHWLTTANWNILLERPAADIPFLYRHSMQGSRYVQMQNSVFDLTVKEPRSLLVLQDECYSNYLHGIDEIKTDTISESVINAKACNVIVGQELERGTRVSLTIRFVPRTTKAVLKLGK